MFRRYRQRRGPYAMTAPSPVPSIIRTIILLAIVILFLWFAGKFIIGLFTGGDGQRTAVTLAPEGRGTVSVSLEGGLLQRAEAAMKLYEGDRVTTGGNGYARLAFFDGSVARLDVQSDVNVVESDKGAEDSSWNVQTAQGALWVRTPSAESFSGAIVRTVASQRYEADLPSDAEAVIEENLLLVFSADGAGVTMRIDGLDDPVVIGEGQQFAFPEGEITGDPYAYRSAIEPLSAQRTFVADSRAVRISAPTGSGGGATGEEDMLVVTSPADRMTVTTATVRVQGTVAKRVERVRVNGHDAVIARADGSFSEELALKDGEETTVTIEALDARGVTLEQMTRTVIRGSQAIAAPTIVTPAKTGETYRTQKTEFAITGTVSAGVAGVMVNDYKLQLFRSGNTSWSYLASTALGNMKDGTNAYDVYALDAAGNKSVPARITILLEPGVEGVVGGGSSTASASSQAQIDETTLPQNEPTMPGTLAVTAPTAGTQHTATGSEFLLEGTTPKETSSVWVNGYRLQLYAPGKIFWNYIAKTEFGTLKRGTNVYRIVARAADNRILDVLEYTVTYNP